MTALKRASACRKKERQVGTWIGRQAARWDYGEAHGYMSLHVLVDHLCVRFCLLFMCIVLVLFSWFRSTRMYALSFASAPRTASWALAARRATGSSQAYIITIIITTTNIMFIIIMNMIINCIINSMINTCLLYVLVCCELYVASYYSCNIILTSYYSCKHGRERAKCTSMLAKS